MLDTVLKVGKVLRAAPDGLKHHRYVKKAPVPDEKNNPVQFWRVPVEADGSFDFVRCESLDDENRQKQLFFLDYKTFDLDPTKRFIYGDIYRRFNLKKNGKHQEYGNYKLVDSTEESGAEPEKKEKLKKRWNEISSFSRGEEASALLNTQRVRQFRNSFRTHLQSIETFLRGNPNTYIHFDFGGKGWHELEEMEVLNKSLLDTFFERVNQGYVSRAFLYKTLATGSDRTPGFRNADRHKNRLFSNTGEALDLLYGINMLKRYAVVKNDIRIIVLPRGENLTAKQIERFFERNPSGEVNVEIEAAEAELREEAQPDADALAASAVLSPDTEEDELFAFLSQEDEQTQSIVQFDFIFSKAGGTKADVDMIELAGLERSKLSYISRRVREKRDEVEAIRREFFLRLFGKPLKKELSGLRITQSFLNIVGDTTRAKKKYQSHLLKVLPQIYTESYFDDPVLLPALVEKTEFNIRNDTANFNLLKFDFFFLTKLQNEGEIYLMALQESPSYRIGALLGTLARGLRSKINSFDKNYAGLISRRIATLPDVIGLHNEINQKLIMHNRVSLAFTFSPQLTEEIKTFSGRYDKDECAFGFFESYFAPFKGDEGDALDSNENGKLSEPQARLDLQPEGSEQP